MSARANWGLFLAAAVLVALAGAAPASAQPAAAPTPADRTIEKYLAQETTRLSARFLDGAASRQEWEERRPRLKQEYLDMLGLWPLPEKTPLYARVTGTLERDDFVVEKLHFQSRPGLYVTGNLYRPKRITGKLPAVLYVCGHSGRGRNGNKTAFQDHGMWFASNGYVCLVIDTLQLGEIPGIHHGTYREGRWWWQSRGYTPAGVECWNGVRAIDYLSSRPDVDAERLAVTGISGGGAATFWIAAADERVKCAVPVSGMSDLESYVTNKVINGHCDCMFLINTYQWEWTTIAALVAPRPLLFANSDNDRIFPMDGNRRIIERLRKLFRMYGKPELVDDYVSVGGHDYRPDLRVAIFKWINKHLKNDTGSVKDSADFKFFANEELRVFPEDKDLPADRLNGRIDQTFVPQVQPSLPEAGQFEPWKQGLLKRLREQSFRPLPERVPAAAYVESEKLRDQWSATLMSQGEVPVKLFWNKEAKDARSVTLLVFPPGGDGGNIPDWARPFAKDQAVVRMELRGSWTTKSPPNYVERAHALLGRTVDHDRVHDLAAVVRSLNGLTQGKVEYRVVGRGSAGVLAAYAALFEPSIQEVVIVDPPTSHQEGPTFLNVMRILDVPEALGLLAPRPLTLVNAKGKAFDRTERIYKLAGAEARLKRQ